MRVKWLTALSLLLSVILSACASKGYWYKSDMRTYDRDFLTCQALGRYTYILNLPNQPQYVLEGFDRGIFNRCMKYRDYEWIKEEREDKR